MSSDPPKDQSQGGEAWGEDISPASFWNLALSNRAMAPTSGKLAKYASTKLKDREEVIEQVRHSRELAFCTSHAHPLGLVQWGPMPDATPGAHLGVSACWQGDWGQIKASRGGAGRA